MTTASFSDWALIENYTYMMSFPTATATTGQALIYTENEEFDLWIADVKRINDINLTAAWWSGTLDGYAAAFRLTTNLSADLAADEYIGLCWYKTDEYLSCSSWRSDGAGIYYASSWLEDVSSVAPYDP